MKKNLRGKTISACLAVLLMLSLLPITAFAVSAPAKPTLKAISAGYNGIKLTWTAVSGATGYEVYRAIPGGTYTKIKTVTGNGYTNTGLTTAKIYYYKVRAYRTSGSATTYGMFSACKYAQPIPATPKLTAVSAGSTRVKLTWKAISGATRYEVFRATSSGGTYTKIKTLTDTSYTNTGLTTAKIYYYKVRAYRTSRSATTYGRFSACKYAKPIPATPKLTAVSAGSTRVKLTWKAISGATRYEVYRATSSGGKYTKIKTLTDTSYTNTGLTTAKAYYYKVRAYRISGSATIYGSFSDCKHAKPIPATPKLTAVSAGKTSVKLTWKAISGATGYEVYLATSSGGTYTKIKTLTGTSYTNTGLITAKTYYYKVRAYRTSGSTTTYGSFSACKYAKPILATPTSVKAVRASSTSIKVAWSAASGAVKYEVYRATSVSGAYSLAGTTTSTSYTNTGLAKDKTYYYKVRAYYLEGSTKMYGGFSSVVYREPSYELTAKRDLLALMIAYPGHIKGLKKENNNTVYVVMQSGKKIIYDDKKKKSYDQKLAAADLQDMMEIVYPLSNITTLMKGNNDPGRIRAYTFLKEVYGSTKTKTKANLISVLLGTKSYPFNKNNNAASALKTVFKRISVLAKSNASINGFVYPLSGTYNYRVIAGTNLLSPHAFGIAIDLRYNSKDYWRWATQKQGQARLNSYPRALVRAFEENGFIWGGKWAHFDIVHYEYRPELIIKSKYLADPNKNGGEWYSGFPNTNLVKGYISIIEDAW